jgi:hypothetical protein
VKKADEQNGPIPVVETPRMDFWIGTGLLKWQWSIYPDAHVDHRNLALHAASAPLFVAGTCALLAAPFAGAAAAVGGAAAMLAAVAAQGRGHKLEAVRPVPFRHAGDFVARFFVEQWVTFPRFVFSGRFAEAWRR